MHSRHHVVLQKHKSTVLHCWLAGYMVWALHDRQSRGVCRKHRGPSEGTHLSAMTYTGRPWVTLSCMQLDAALCWLAGRLASKAALDKGPVAPVLMLATMPVQNTTWETRTGAVLPVFPGGAWTGSSICGRIARGCERAWQHRVPVTGCRTRPSGVAGTGAR